MPKKSIEVFVEPDVLVWARKTRGKREEDVARRLGKSEEFIRELEAGERKLRLRQLETLANFYKRPLAAFFLSKPPEEPSPPEDHRTFPEGERTKEFSPETLLAIRRAQLLQASATELASSLGYETNPRIGKTSLPERFEDLIVRAKALAIRERKKIGVMIDTQSRWKGAYKALNEWKRQIEDMGVLVFQMSMPPKETRGFSLTEDGFPVIVLNSKEHPNPRIFSLFHEYAHLLLNHGGICDMKHRNHIPIEIFCNHFAGAFLVPREALLNHKLVKSRKSYPEWPQEKIEELSGYFKVSWETVLRRLLILDLTTERFYQMKREQWQKKWEEKENVEGKKKRGGPLSPIKCFSENGAPFVSFVLEAYREEKISSTDVADYLGVKLKHLPDIEQLMVERT